MPNGGNLPKLVIYGNKIKDITISKFISGETSGFRDYYFIKFTEIVEKKITIKGIFRNKTEIKNSEIERIVPFSFVDLESAKDFAQYIPGMKIQGERLYSNIYDRKVALIYETYELDISGLGQKLYVKFLPHYEHFNVQYTKRTDEGKNSYTYDEYYINDIDKRSFNGEQGYFFEYNEEVAEGFFTEYEFTMKGGDCKIVPNWIHKKISDFKLFETNNTHKFILMEQ